MLAMAERRARMTFDVPERVKRALNIEASRRDCSVGDIIARLVEQHLPDTLHIADTAIAEESPEGTNKRGRPRKSRD